MAITPTMSRNRPQCPGVTAPSPPSRRTAVGAIVAVLVVVAAACSGDSADDLGTTTTAPALSTTTTVRVDDGVLRVGLVVPRVGAGAQIGATIETGVRLALEQINSSGGVNGVPVSLLVRDEGDNPAAALLAVSDLLVGGVDAIIGPTATSHLLRTLPGVVDAGVLTCAPVATALALDVFPDNGLLIRTIASDSLQARGIADVVDESGAARAAVVYFDDPFGRPFATEVERSLASVGVALEESVGFNASGESVREAAGRVADSDADVVVVLADGVSGPTMVDAIDAASTDPLAFIVNDAQRRPLVSSLPFDAELAPRVQGVSPLARVADPEFELALRGIDAEASTLFAHTGYDCLNLIALAAQGVGVTQPPAIAAAVSGISNGGTSCRSFPVCMQLLATGRNIDYDGPRGELSIGADGDVTVGVLEQFGFDESGNDLALRSFLVESD